MRTSEKSTLEKIIIGILIIAGLIIGLNVKFNLVQSFGNLLQNNNPIVLATIILVGIALVIYIAVSFFKSTYYLELNTSKLIRTNPILYSVLTLVAFSLVFKVNFNEMSPTIYSLFIFIAEFIGFVFIVALGIEALVFVWNHISKKHQIHIGNNFDQSLHF